MTDKQKRQEANLQFNNSIRDKDNKTQYIAHACLNSKLSPKHKDYCNKGFVDIAPSIRTCSEQCWKYCPECEAKGFPVITKYNKNPQRIKQGKKFGFKTKQNIQAE